ncbi:MAG: PD40 domain-containing protein [Acidobacteria bacterium]|nr:PD40 domain-containing protein [Acidobacteriota bacterium]
MNGMAHWIMAAAFAAQIAHGAAQQSAAGRELEAAIYKEVVQGDLKGAAEQYRRIAAQYAKQPEVAARALYQLGRCQEKLGQAEARRSYERVVKEYSASGQYASAARARLAALASGTTPAGGMSLQRVDSGERFRLVKGVSSDGRLIGFSYSDSGGSQGLYDTVTREEKILVKLDWNGDTYGGTPLLSRDGKWLVFATYKARAQDAELRVIRADGSGMRTLFKLTGNSWVIPKDWTPDQRHALVQVSSQGTTHLCLVNIVDGEVRRLKQVSSSDHHAFVSPDGTHVVYVAGAAVRSGPPAPEEVDPDLLGTHVRLMAVDGSSDQELLPGGPVARPMGWAPDGSGVLLWSRKGGDPGVWFVPVANGKASGEPKLLRAGMPAHTWPAGLTADGKFYFVEEARKLDSYLVRLDAGSGEPGKAERVTARFEGGNGYATWSPDGKKLAWFGFTYSGTLVHIRDLATGRERTLSFPVSPGPFSPQWLSDSRTILYRSGSATGLYEPQSLRGFDTETGESRLVAEGVNGFPAVAKDASIIYMTGGGSDFRTITAFDTRAKAKRQLVTLDGSTFHLAVSPDGKSLACVVIGKWTSRRLLFVDTQTGHVREWGETQARGIPFNRRSISWTPDGANVVIRTDNGVWAYPVAGGERRLLLKTDGPTADVALSPDGKTMAYTRTGARYDLWVLEKFLPARK